MEEKYYCGSCGEEVKSCEHLCSNCEKYKDIS